jgi:preprotein translocase subunit SecA
MNFSVAQVARVRLVIERNLDLTLSDEDLVVAVGLASGQSLGERHRNLRRLQPPERPPSILGRRTAVIALAATLAAEGGRTVHVATMHQAQAELEAATLGPALAEMNLSLGCLLPKFSYLYDPNLEGLTEKTRSEALSAQIVYGAFAEFGFDQLARTLTTTGDWQYEGAKFARALDLILVEDLEDFLANSAPLLITQTAPDQRLEILRLSNLIATLEAGPDEDGDYEVVPGENGHNLGALWSSRGLEKLVAGLGDEEVLDPDSPMRKLANAVLYAQAVFIRELDYVVSQNQIIPLADNGDLLPRRYFNDGVQEALEAKEGLTVNRGAAPLAGITPEAYLDLYVSVAGLMN